MDARGGLSWAASASINVTAVQLQGSRAAELWLGLARGLVHVCGLTVVTLTVLCSYADSSFRNSGGPARV